jgi:glycosyltransferase involved in cell wall biosynthesis
MTSFSVILPTRNRPHLFAVALRSVLEQTRAPEEIIVVDDGSSDESILQYDELLRPLDWRLRRIALRRTPRGHGPSHARNAGAAGATGEYLCFLDDDDFWTDPHYLERVARTIAEADGRVDLHLSDQAAYSFGERRAGPVWIEDLGPRLLGQGRRCHPAGSFTVSVDDLVKAHGFCHLNTLVIRRRLFDEIGGMDERLSYEEDRDFYLRAIDAAREIRYAPITMSHHNVPDARQATSASVSINTLEQCRIRLFLLEKALHSAKHKAIRDYALSNRSYTIKKMAEFMERNKNYAYAFYYARIGLAARPSLKWVGYTAYLMLRSYLSRWRWMGILPASALPMTPGDVID